MRVEGVEVAFLVEVDTFPILNLRLKTNKTKQNKKSTIEVSVQLTTKVSGNKPLKCVRNQKLKPVACGQQVIDMMEEVFWEYQVGKMYSDYNGRRKKKNDAE